MNRFNSTFYLIAGVSLLILLLVIFLIVRPVVFGIWENYQKAKTAQEELNLLELERETLLDLQKSKKETDDLYNKIATFLPEKINGGDFVVQLENIANQNNQNQTEIKIKEEKSKQKTIAEQKTTTNETVKGTQEETIQERVFTLTQTGFFPDLVNFLKNLEQSSRLNTLEKLSITREENNSLTIEIEGLIYYKPGITIQDTLASLQITPQEEKEIMDLEHFGEIISIKSMDDVQGGRSDPFAPF